MLLIDGLTISITLFKICNKQGVFLTGPPLKMSLDWPPPKNASTGPPLLWKSSKYGGWDRGDSEYFNIFNTYGGPVWDSNVFLKSVTYWPTLSKFRGGPVKKTGRLGYRIQLTVHTRFQRNIYPASCIGVGDVCFFLTMRCLQKHRKYASFARCFAIFWNIVKTSHR